jgi:1-deoxyxylulose-5-phosphate synthase
MNYVNLGHSGLKVSRICLGMMTYGSSTWRDWVLDEAESRPFIRRALDLGINFFDTADAYSAGASEEVTGRVLLDYVGRQEVVIATKVFFHIDKGPNGGGLSRKHIMEGIDNSLRRLGTDYIDLYQIHRWDYATPIEETMEALHDAVKAGKALYIGASSMYAWQFAKAQHTADHHHWTRFVSMQNHLNLIYREEEREMLPLCLDQGVAVLPWSPLARGFLAGNRTREEARPTTRAKSDAFAHDMYYQPEDFDVVDQVMALAQRRDVTPAQIALAWLLHRPGVTAPIIGASKMHHLEEAVAALEVKLSAEEMQQLEEPYRPHRVLGHE